MTMHLGVLALNIVHYDLKPGNIFLDCVNGKLIAVIADFGLARFVGE